MLFEIQRRSPVRHREPPLVLPPRWIIPRNSDHPPSLPVPSGRTPPQIPVPPRAALASLVDEFRVCCQSLFRAIISQHFDMTYKPAGGGYRGTVRGRSGEARVQGEGAGGQWEDGAALVDAGGSIRGERSAMRGTREREIEWRSEREREGGKKRGAVSTREGQGDVTHARGTVNASAIRQTHETCPSSAPFGRRVSRTHRISPLPPLEVPPRRFPPASFYLAMTPFPPPRILLLPADACNSPMLNATFASLHSS